MTTINTGRHTAGEGADGLVLFLIGMRLNQLWRVWKWFPVFVAMPRMLAELARNPEFGMVGRPRTLVSGRTIMVWQYWRSFDHLEAYAKSQSAQHLPAWRAFNRRVRNNGSVGIFHETIVLTDATTETVYANMPVTGLAAVTGAVPVAPTSGTARTRLTGTDAQPPVVEPY